MMNVRVEHIRHDIAAARAEIFPAHPSYSSIQNQYLWNLKQVILTVEDSLTEIGLEQWLVSPLRTLNGQTALDTLRGGCYDKVLQAAHAWNEGVYL